MSEVYKAQRGQWIAVKKDGHHAKEEYIVMRVVKAIKGKVTDVSYGELAANANVATSLAYHHVRQVYTLGRYADMDLSRLAKGLPFKDAATLRIAIVKNFGLAG